MSVIDWVLQDALVTHGIHILVARIVEPTCRQVQAMVSTTKADGCCIRPTALYRILDRSAAWAEDSGVHLD